MTGKQSDTRAQNHGYPTPNMHTETLAEMEAKGEIGCNWANLPSTVGKYFSHFIVATWPGQPWSILCNMVARVKDGSMSHDRG